MSSCLKKDVCAWRYEYLKNYYPSIFQHQNPLTKTEYPFTKKKRYPNPLLPPLIQKDVKNLCDANINIPMRYSTWVPNLVSIKKKNGEIRPCVDFRNLNKASFKDNFPLPKMD